MWVLVIIMVLKSGSLMTETLTFPDEASCHVAEAQIRAPWQNVDAVRWYYTQCAGK